ncbi:MAG: hypothetical protein GY756_19660, partial [bacterium]|nr:hypothetical protein [bacterium]
MESKEFNEKINELFKFVSLHGWCKDVDDRLLDITENIDSNNKKILKDSMKDRLISEKQLRDESVLSIVLLNKIDFPCIDLSENLYKILFEKIYDQDFDFLIWQMFDKKHPFPADITNNMIRRDFLSYRRAINEAFKINTIISDISSEKAVLYLTLLLCHRTLNDQNKAMIYFLLSRIDIKLPDNLFRQTMIYIYKLRSVIKAIEEDSDSALSESIDFRDELAKPPVESEKEAEKDNNQKPLDSTLNENSENILKEDSIESVVDENDKANIQEALKNQDNITEDESLNQISVKNQEVGNNEVGIISSEGGLNSTNTDLDFNSLDDSKNVTNNMTILSENTEKELYEGDDIDSDNLNRGESTDENPESLETDEKESENTIISDEKESFTLTFSKSLEEILKLAEQYAKDNNLKEEAIEEDSGIKRDKRESDKNDIEEDSLAKENKPELLKETRSGKE